MSMTLQSNAAGVRHYREDGIAVILIDSPPVNALGAAARAGLFDALALYDADSATYGVVISGARQTFSAGADISEFGKPKGAPDLRSVIARIATLSKPVVAALQGYALGGGLEVALACRYRVAAHGTMLGLPEIRLGLIPGAGGTVRLPRIVGPIQALEMILSGAPVTAEQAADIKLVDAVVEGDPIAAAREFLLSRDQENKEDGRFWLPSSDELAAFEAAAARMTARHGSKEASRAAIDVIRAALFVPAEEALTLEGNLFAKLLSGAECHALRHLFAAERQAAKLPDLDSDTPVRPIAQVGVVGAGTMGVGIAMAFANSGLSVTMVDTDYSSLTRGLQTIARSYDSLVAKGRLDMTVRDERILRILGSTNLLAVAPCDLVVEAVFEDMAVKKAIFERLGKITRPGAILATNTSYLDVAQIARATSRPCDVVGLHFFSPAHVMKLLEIVRTDLTGKDVVASAISLAKRLDKMPVVVGNCYGFVGNRMLAARGAENEALLMEGALPAQIDKVFTDFGWPMGPFQMIDLAGLDIGWRTRRSRGASAPVADWLCEQGFFGQKSGRGFYLYNQGSRAPLPNAELNEHIEALSAAANIRRRSISEGEILERTLFPMINEGRKILREGIARQASDIDVVWVHGYGFPRDKGGPMFWAANQKQYDIDTTLRRWYDLTGREHFRPFSDERTQVS